MRNGPGRVWKTGSGILAGVSIVLLFGGLPARADAPAHSSTTSDVRAVTPPAATPATLPYDRTKYMAPDELSRGMKGFGRTVMAGTEIETFQFEVISVLKNAFEPRQDVILVRCSGLDLENSGVAAGMSGSPCYIRDDSGRTRMIGAVAFGWSLSKAPICGVQPITQMLGIPDVRRPENRPKLPAPESQPSGNAAANLGRGFSMGELIARVHSEPIDSRSRLSVFNDDIAKAAKPAKRPMNTDHELQPLTLPVMVSGASARAREWMQGEFDRLGLKLVASGAPSGADKAAADKTEFEPGSVLSIPLMTGDLNMEVIGTCTEVIGDRVLGFGHSLFARGHVELPLATGMIHTIFPSILQSFKIGSAVKTVGTLWGDEKAGVFGIRGPAPATAPLRLTFRDIRGRQVFNYQMARDPTVTAMLLAAGVAAGIYSHNELPDDHVVKYRIRMDFEGAGVFETANFTSYIGVYGLAQDLLLPAFMLSSSPFGDAKINSANVDVEVEAGTRSARIDRLDLPRMTYKPGETVSARIRWRHDRTESACTEATYDMVIPADLKDGEYALTYGSAQANLSALRSEKPHKFRAETMGQIVEALNLATSFPQNRLYARLAIPRGGMAVGREEMPDLPSYRQKILMDTRRNDITAYTDALVTHYDTDFVVDGGQTVTIKVSRKTEY